MSAAQLWVSAQARYAEAAARLGTTQRRYQFGGVQVRICMAGTALWPLLNPALQHRALPAATAADNLTLYLWESSQSGVPGPDAPMSLAAWQQAQATEPRGALHLTGTAAPWGAFDLGSYTLSLLSAEGHEGFYWVGDVAAVPHHEQGAPLRGLLSRALSVHGWQWAHAGAVGNAQGAVLFCGPGGSGKSTSVLACLDDGMAYLSDDYCLVRAAPTPQVASVYNTAKLKTLADAERFPKLAGCRPSAAPRPDGKVIFWLYPDRSEQLLATVPLRALVLPRITPGLSQSRLRACGAAEALRTLAPSSLLQLPGAGQAALHSLAQVVRAVPSYVLELSPDLVQIPLLMQTLLE